MIMRNLILSRPRAGLAALVLAGWLLMLAGPALAGPPAQPSTPGPVQAIIAVERAPVFPVPDRNATPLTYLFEREQILVQGRTEDWRYLQIEIDETAGWILRVQVELAGDLAIVPITDRAPTTPTVTFTPFAPSPVPGSAATRTPLPTGTPAGTPFPPGTASAQPTLGAENDAALTVLPGVPPPVELTLPEDWEQVHFVVPFRTFDGEVHDVPLTIYFGPLPDGATGFIYLYWGYPYTVDYVTGEYNLWADGVQILRGSLVGETCNLGLYDQETFTVGQREGPGAFYQTSECEGETDTSGWFVAVRAFDGSFAFFTAVEPWDALSENRLFLQRILDSARFLPPEED